MKKTLFAIAATVLFSGAYAQGHTQEVAAPTNTKSQRAAEARKATKPAGVQSIKDGSTAEGEGSGIKRTTQPEAHGQSHQATREAAPHQDSGQGGTPK